MNKKYIYVIIILAAASFYAYQKYWYLVEDLLTDEFETHVYNINNDRLWVYSIPYDDEVHIGAGFADPNGYASAWADYTERKHVTLRWGFAPIVAKSLGENRYDCHMVKVDLPERGPDEIDLVIGIYDKKVVRVRWSDNAAKALIGMTLDNNHPESAWDNGLVPLPRNWRKKTDKGWPVPTEWDEDVDGGKYDSIPNRRWLTFYASPVPCGE